MVEPEGTQMTSQHGAHALCAGLARLHARIRMHTPTRPSTHIHARTRKHAHTDQYAILTAFPQQQWLRERASILGYTYIVCLVANMIIHHSHNQTINISAVRMRTSCPL
jgi:hypothetical protein